VLDDRRLVGIVTRSDVLRTRKVQLELERLQQRAHLRRRRPPSDPEQRLEPT
jgi:hypothetical protein